MRHRLRFFANWAVLTGILGLGAMVAASISARVSDTPETGRSAGWSLNALLVLSLLLVLTGVTTLVCEWWRNTTVRYRAVLVVPVWVLAVLGTTVAASVVGVGFWLLLSPLVP